MADCPQNVCDVCSKTFKARKNLYEHQRNVHGIQPNSGTSIKCPSVNCKFTCNFLSALRTHVEMHGVKVEVKNLSFASVEEFTIWKEEEEKNSLSKFIKHNAVKRMRDGTKAYYACHRSGKYTPRGSAKRQLKSQGSCKIGCHCTAGIEMMMNSTGCSARYYSTHFGHNKNMGYLHITDSDRQAIAGKITEGVTFQRILDDIREDVTEKITRLHLTTRQDLHNIRRDYNLKYQEGQEHSLDPVSVELWVKNNEESVLVFKQQGKNDESGNNFGNKDFVLVIMTIVQKELLLKFGNEIVCIDSTHGTNQYDFNVTTLLVLDEFGAGIPVVFCISNKEDTHTMSAFFSAIKTKTGRITPKTFMSDDANAFINAWTDVMGKPQKQLLCSWHVDKNWRSNLCKVKGGKLKQILVYKALRTLLEASTVEKLSELLGPFLLQLSEDEDTKDFGKYFSQYYAVRPEVWAYSYRANAGINTNMHLEAMHRVLKHCYLEGRKNKRLDKLLVVLMKVVRDKCFDRVVKMCKGKVTHRLSLIHSSHRSACNILPCDIQSIEEGKTFSVTSQTNAGIAYTVEFYSQDCPVNCKLRCQACSICIHSYTCSCRDHLILHNICKHIHAVAQNLKNTNNGLIVHSLDEIQVPQAEFAIIENAVKTMNVDMCNADEAERKRVETKLQALVYHIQSESVSVDTLRVMRKHLDPMLEFMNAHADEISNTEPANKKAEKQRRLVQKIKRHPRRSRKKENEDNSEKKKRCFFKTKRSRQSKETTKLSKPTLAEKQNIMETFTCPEVEIPQVHTEFDHQYL